MAAGHSYRLYALLQATPTLNKIYAQGNLEDLTQYTRELLRRHPYNTVPVSPRLMKSIAAIGAPSKSWTPDFVATDEHQAIKLEELVVAYAFDDPASLQEFKNIVVSTQAASDFAPIRSVGADIGIAGADHWCPGAADLGVFGRRDDARRTIDAGALASVPTGSCVNVVIIDGGLNRAAIKPANWGGGLNWQGTPPDTVLVGTADRTSHGMMIARSVLDLAPDAVLYDVPLLPKRIAHVTAYLSKAHAAYVAILGCIDSLRAALPRNPQVNGPWILVNAWAIFDRATETSLGDYTENKEIPVSGSADGHPLITQVKSNAIGQHKFDVIFAAGNCGEFCFSIRCGDRDRGPGHSIWGANALSAVITAGAVRADGIWAGYSSQGPGPGTGTNHLAVQKPDLCAPSNFLETLDASVANTGTSTACAMTAGVVAALRSNPAWDQTKRTPAQMLAALRAGARKTPGPPGWDGRLGYGILDIAGTKSHL